MGFRRIALPYIIAAILLLPGCYGYRVSVPHPDPITEYEGETAHSLLWGLIQDPQYIVANNCDSNALDEVYIRSNFAYSLATVMSLGIWAPLDVQWRCAEGGTQAGTDDGAL